MKTAKFQYKCRLCGEIYDGACTGEINALNILMHIVFGISLPEDLFGVLPSMVSIHAGCKVGYGVADLIGYVVEEK